MLRRSPSRGALAGGRPIGMALEGGRPLWCVSGLFARSMAVTPNYARRTFGREPKLCG